MAWALVLAAEAHAAIIKPQAPSDSPAVSYRWPIATAPVMAKAPTMDGAVGREEWAAAAQLAPMVTLEHGLATDETTAMFVGYTAEALYIAFKFGRPPYALEPKSSPEPLAVWGDDCIEFFLRPEFGAKWEYSFVGNAAGVHEEGRRKGNTDKGWKCDWRYAARRTDWGWEGEMAIPFASLGVATPKPGEVWEIAPVRNQKTPRQDLACWSYLKDWNACEDFGYLAFGGDAPAVRVLQAGEISRNEVGALVEVANFTAKDATLTVNMTLLKPKADDLEYFSVVDTAANPLGQQTDAKDSVDAKKVAETALQRFAVLKKAEQTLTVPARQTRRIPFTTESTRGNYILHYEVREAQSGAILSAGPLPFYRRAPLEVALTPYLLSAGVVEVAADYRKLLGVQQGDQVVVQVLDPGRTKVLREKREAVNLAARQTVIDVPASDLPPGGYAVRCLLNAADGQSKAEREQDFKLAPKPAWWDNKFGCPEATDSVPEPWTPMSPAGEPRPYGGEKTASGFEVWNRKVTLGEALQPSQIANGRVEMLARPVRLDIKAAGLAWGAVEVVKATKTGIAWRQTLRGENLSGELLLSAEFDGFMKYTLRLEPKAAATLERMVLVIPLKPEVVTHYQHGALGTPPSRTEVKVTKGYGVLQSEGLAL
ncbi:MAG: hypothetical protein FJ279_33275, partial [Planctomycetes bacterium]|nr:hypothetical protein [Planctomycetota bacterium]